MQRVLSLGASENRMEAYRLLSERAPAKVLIDDDMPVGTWTIVRGPTEFEARELRRHELEVKEFRRELQRKADEDFRKAVSSGVEMANAARVYLTDGEETL